MFERNLIIGKITFIMFKVTENKFIDANFSYKKISS